MTTPEATQLIVSISGLLTAISLMLSYFNRKGIQEVKKATDGMKDELVQATKKVGEAEVKVARGEGRDEERAKQESGVITLPQTKK